MKQKRTLFTVKVINAGGIWETTPIETYLTKGSKVIGIVKYEGEKGKELYKKEIVVTE